MLSESEILSLKGVILFKVSVDLSRFGRDFFDEAKSIDFDKEFLRLSSENAEFLRRLKMIAREYRAMEVEASDEFVESLVWSEHSGAMLRNLDLWDAFLRVVDEVTEEEEVREGLSGLSLTEGECSLCRLDREQEQSG